VSIRSQAQQRTVIAVIDEHVVRRHARRCLPRANLTRSACMYVTSEEEQRPSVWQPRGVKLVAVLHADLTVLYG